MNIKTKSGKTKKAPTNVAVDTLKVLPDGSVMIMGNIKGGAFRSFEISADLFNQLVRTRNVMDQLEAAVTLPQAG